MKNMSQSFDLANYSVQELDSKELVEINGGNIFGAIGYAIGFVYGATLGALVRVTNWMYDNAFPPSPYNTQELS